MLAVREDKSAFWKLKPLWDDPLTAALAASSAPPPLKERFSGRFIVFSTGRENDETGLYYYRARYYSPTMQRFVSEDPTRFFGGINFYTYAACNPVRFVDPLGFIKIKRGVDATDLSPAITSTFDVIDRVTQERTGKSEGTITSGREGRHRLDSKHYRGEAIDIRGNDVSDEKMREVSRELQRQLGNDYDVVPELFPENPLKDHIHIEFDPPTKDALGCRKC